MIAKDFRGPKAFIIRKDGATFDVFDPNDGTVRSAGHATEMAAYEWISSAAEEFYRKLRLEKARDARNPWERLTWDLTTGHVTKEDAFALTDHDCQRSNEGLRSTNHEHGWIIFIPCGLEDDELESWKEDLRANSWSEALINILIAAVKADVPLINFDQDGDAHDDFPTFEW